MAINGLNRGNQKLNLTFRCKPQLRNIDHSFYFVFSDIATHHLILKLRSEDDIAMENAFELQHLIWILFLHVWAAALQLKRDIIPAGHAEN